jgi:hypothetical protein
MRTVEIIDPTTRSEPGTKFLIRWTIVGVRLQAVQNPCEGLVPALRGNQENESF